MQQATEKYLKALLVFVWIPPLYVHSSICRGACSCSSWHDLL